MTVEPHATEQPQAVSRAPAGSQTRSASPMVKRMMLWLLAHPGVTRFLLRVAGRVSPVLVLGRHVIVTGCAEICAVLSRDADFVLNADSHSVMLDGPFVLRMELGPQYLREIEVLRRVAGPQDLPRVRAIAKAEAEQRIRGLGSGRVDVVADLAVPVGMRLITDYLGASDPAPPPDLVLWLRRLAGFIVVGGFNDPTDRQAAEEAAAALRRYVESLMAARRRALETGTAGDDVLTRLMTMARRGEVDEDLVRRNYTGLLIVSHAVVVNAMALAVDELLRRPDALAGARAVAAVADSTGMTGYALEALRFSPVFPLLSRFSPRPTDLVDGAGKSHPIPAGASIIVGTIAGMCDPGVFRDPAQFDPTRELRNYLIFGHGTHACFGLHIAATEMPEMLIALFKLPGLRRAPGELGEPRYEGPAIVRLQLDFQP